MFVTVNRCQSLRTHFMNNNWPQTFFSNKETFRWGEGLNTSRTKMRLKALTHVQSPSARSIANSANYVWAWFLPCTSIWTTRLLKNSSKAILLPLNLHSIYIDLRRDAAYESSSDYRYLVWFLKCVCCSGIQRNRFGSKCGVPIFNNRLLCLGVRIRQCCGFFVRLRY